MVLVRELGKGAKNKPLLHSLLPGKGETSGRDNDIMIEMAQSGNTQGGG